MGPQKPSESHFGTLWRCKRKYEDDAPACTGALFWGLEAVPRDLLCNSCANCLSKFFLERFLFHNFVKWVSEFRFCVTFSMLFGGRFLIDFGFNLRGVWRLGRGFSSMQGMQVLIRSLSCLATPAGCGLWEYIYMYVYILKMPAVGHCRTCSNLHKLLKSSLQMRNGLLCRVHLTVKKISVILLWSPSRVLYHVLCNMHVGCLFLPFVCEQFATCFFICVYPLLLHLFLYWDSFLSFLMFLATSGPAERTMASGFKTTPKRLISPSPFGGHLGNPLLSFEESKCALICQCFFYWFFWWYLANVGCQRGLQRSPSEWFWTVLKAHVGM